MAQSELYRNALKPGQMVLWYEVERTLGQGGFGITYVALDTNLHQRVAIKEFLPTELAVREGDSEVQPVSSSQSGHFAWGLDKFMDEARTLAHFDHPNIVKVYTVFEANNTAYMVMRYEEGMSLGSIFSKRKRLPERLLQHLVHPLLDGLETVHDQGFIHRDIKPDNIYLRQDASPVLLDFGSARIAVGSETRALTTLVSPGYAPFEQYVPGSDRQGPWSDVYSLGATLYRGICGVPPQDATNRSEALSYTGKDVFVNAREVGRGKYSDSFLRAVDSSLAFRYDERPQSVAEWRTMFRAKKSRRKRREDVEVEEIETRKVDATEFQPRAGSDNTDDDALVNTDDRAALENTDDREPLTGEDDEQQLDPPTGDAPRSRPLTALLLGLLLASVAAALWYWFNNPPPQSDGMARHAAEVQETLATTTEEVLSDEHRDDLVAAKTPSREVSIARAADDSNIAPSIQDSAADPAAKTTGEDATPAQSAAPQNEPPSTDTAEPPQGVDFEPLGELDKPPSAKAIPAQDNAAAMSSTAATNPTTVEHVESSSCQAALATPLIPAMGDRGMGSQDTSYPVSSIRLRGPAHTPYPESLGRLAPAVEALRSELVAANHGEVNAEGLERLADKLTEGLREDGLLATAIVPMQYLESGTLTVVALDWRLGDASLVGAPASYQADNESVIERILGAMKGSAPSAASLKRAMLTMILDEQFHGSAFGVLQPGRRLMEFDITLKWQNNKPQIDPESIDPARLYIYTIAGNGAQLPYSQLTHVAAANSYDEQAVADYQARVIDLLKPVTQDPNWSCQADALLAAYRDNWRRLADSSPAGLIR